MQLRTKKLIYQLASKIVHLDQPIHLLAVCSGGIILAKTVAAYLKKKHINVKYYEVWTNSFHGRRAIWKTSFKKSDYKGTAVIVEDVIWQGASLPPIKSMLRKMNSKRKIYVISLLDCNHKADYSVYN